MHKNWLHQRDRLVIAAWIIGTSVVELWAQLVNETARSALQPHPDEHHATTLRLVARSGQLLDTPEEFHR